MNEINECQIILLYYFIVSKTDNYKIGKYTMVINNKYVLNAYCI